jgi:hypothetical protein
MIHTLTLPTILDAHFMHFVQITDLQEGLKLYNYYLHNFYTPSGRDAAIKYTEMIPVHVSMRMRA